MPTAPSRVDVDVLARTDRVGDVAGHLAPLLAQAARDTGSKAATMSSFAARQLRELDRLANRLGRRLGAVCANHDALEQAVPFVSSP